MTKDKQYEYAKHSEGLRGYAAIYNKIIYILGIDCFIPKNATYPTYYARYYFLDDPDRHVFKTDTSIITKIKQETAEILYDRSSPTIQRNTK